MAFRPSQNSSSASTIGNSYPLTPFANIQHNNSIHNSLPSPSQVRPNGTGTGSFLTSQKYDKLRNVIYHICNFLTILAALGAAYVALELALWTAAKDYRDDCRGQYEVFKNMSVTCERILRVDLSPPLGLDNMIKSASKRSIEDRPSLVSTTTSRLRLSASMTSKLIYVCLIITAIHIIIHSRNLLLTCFEWAITIQYPSFGAHKRESTPSRSSSPGLYEHLIGGSMVQASRASGPLPLVWLLPPGQRAPLQTEQQETCHNENLTQLSDSASPSQVSTRQRRGYLPDAASDDLEHWFNNHLDHPYPTEEEKQTLAKRTGRPLPWVTNWFINARRRQLESKQEQMNLIRKSNSLRS